MANKMKRIYNPVTGSFTHVGKTEFRHFVAINRTNKTQATQSFSKREDLDKYIASLSINGVGITFTIWNEEVVVV
jgi:hypothetical protein